MSEDSNSQRAFLMEVRTRAEAALEQSHIDADTKTLIKDLLHVGNNFIEHLNQSGGQSADVRMVKRKMDVIKQELKASENKVEILKQAILAVSNEVRVANSEAMGIQKRHPEGTDADNIACTKIRGAAQKIIESIVKATT